MSFNNQQQAPAGDLLWEQERETGRWYTPYSDAGKSHLSDMLDVTPNVGNSREL